MRCAPFLHTDLTIVIAGDWLAFQVAIAIYHKLLLGNSVFVLPSDSPKAQEGPL